MDIIHKDPNFAINHMCRTCTKIAEETMLFPLFEEELSLKVSPIGLIQEFNFINLKIIKDDGLPQQVCNECIARLVDINEFRKTCEESQIVLEKHYSTNQNEADLNDTNNMEIIFINDLNNEIIGEVLNAKNIDEGQYEGSDSQLGDEENNSKVYEDNLEEESASVGAEIKENISKCETCEITFKSIYTLQRHNKRKHSFGDFKCTLCTMEFSNQFDFEKHVKSHKKKRNSKIRPSKEKPYQCDICGEGFRLGRSLTKHARLHNPTPYKCDACDKAFKGKHLLLIHQRNHTKIKPVQCSICLKSFNYPNQLQRHMNTHSDNRLFVCEICGKSYVCANGLKRHLETHTVEKSIKPPQPYIPNRNKSTKLINNYAFSCPVCEKKFKIALSLTKHLKIHSKERNYACTMCKMRFNRGAHLQRHIAAIHLKEKPFACDHCGKTFLDVSDLKLHSRTHTDEKSYKCLYCDKSYHFLNHLRVHERSHTREKKYPCGICSMSFITYSALCVHGKRHSEAERMQDKERRLLELTDILPPSEIALISTT